MSEELKIPASVLSSNADIRSRWQERMKQPPRLVSALHWLPRITEVGLPVPPTEIVPYCHIMALAIFDGEQSSDFDSAVSGVVSALGKIGLPAFIRTDLTSAKHSGPKAYKIENIDLVHHHVAETIEDSELKMGFGPDEPRAFLVREFLELEATFTAFHGLPISREWRLFASPGGVTCRHPYWPEETLDGHTAPVVQNWRELLAEMHVMPEEMPELEAMAVLAARACGGKSWSVDFCRDTDGKWWLLDMAPAEVSYHWPGCPEASA